MIRRLFVLSILLLSSAGILSAGQSGPLAPTAFKGVKQAGPQHSSKFYIHEATVNAGKAEVDLLLDTPKGAIAVIMGEQNIQANAQDKQLNGISYYQSDLEMMDLPAMGTRFNLDQVNAGQIKMNVSNTGKADVLAIVAQPESPVALLTRVSPLAVRVGDWVTVEAQLADSEALPHKNTFIKGKLSNGSAVKLADNGKGVDRIAGDGIFTGKFRAPNVKKMQSIKIQLEAKGQRGFGTDMIQRTGVASVMVTEPAGGFSNDVYADDGAIHVPLKAAQGKFRVSIIYAVNGKNLAWAEEDITLADENAELSIDHPQVAFGADQAVVRLLNFQTGGLEAEQLIQLQPNGEAPVRSNAQFAPKALPQSKQNALVNLK
jgi:sulfur carrier protein ThiS